MAISVFHLFSIGIGPSSSHTVGPMRAARRFVVSLDEIGIINETEHLKIDLYGSLALTGKGHATDIAVMLGLEGAKPEDTDPNSVQLRIAFIRKSKTLNVFGKKTISFDEPNQLLFHGDKILPFHPNAMRISAYDKDHRLIKTEVFYSVGGGFVVDHESVAASQNKEIGEESHKLPFQFKDAATLLRYCKEQNMTIAELMMENEKTWHAEEDVKIGLLHIWDVMKACVERGCEQEGILPGGLNVKRRAKGIYQNLLKKEADGKIHPADLLEWVSLWALAVNEENAAGSRVVTAPTNGAAGVIPSVIHYMMRFTENPTNDSIVKFMLTAGAMGILYKEGASISAAEMGCMGEVGVACSMAAAGLAAVLGGTNDQIENAAEIGMEHNLGLTCDPIMGLVQIPCIERNTMGAIKAINAALLAMQGDGTHRVSLDQVIATMRQTGNDMQSIYKETSQGGLAVNVPEC